LTRLHYDFELWARDDQLPPDAAQAGGAWTIWLMLGGRGASTSHKNRRRRNRKGRLEGGFFCWRRA